MCPFCSNKEARTSMNGIARSSNSYSDIAFLPEVARVTGGGGGATLLGVAALGGGFLGEAVSRSPRNENMAGQPPARSSALG